MQCNYTIQYYPCCSKREILIIIILATTYTDAEVNNIVLVYITQAE